MKYLKKLKTTAEYEAYKNSEEFVKPNITLISTEHKTHMTVGDNYEESDCPEEYKGNQDYDNTIKEESKTSKKHHEEK